MLEDIRRRILEGQTYLGIAKAHGIDESTVRGHFERTIRPQWAAEIADRLAAEVAKVEYLEQVAWERFHASCEPTTTEQLKHELLHAKGRKPCERLVERAVKTVTTSGVPAWLEIVKWCREWFARVGGWYQTRDEGTAANKVEVLPVVLVRIESREEARKAISFQELQERAARDQQN